MKHTILRLMIAALLAGFLFVWLLPGETGGKAEISAPSTLWNGNVNIHIRSADAVRQADGRYLVEVSFTTDTAEDPSDLLVVTVFGREQIVDFPLTEDNMGDVHKVCFTEAVQPEQIRVEIRAHQTEADLLLLCDGDGQICGEAAAPVNGDRCLTISGAAAGAAYQIYWVAGLSDLLSGTVVLSLRPSARELEAYTADESYVTTMIADAYGNASCNFTQAGFADGVYLAVGEGKAFYVCLPSVEASGEFRSSAVTVCGGPVT